MTVAHYLLDRLATESSRTPSRPGLSSRVGSPDLHYGVVRVQSSPPGRLQRTPRGRKRRSDACRTGAQSPEGADAQRQRARSKLRRSAEGYPLENGGVGRCGCQPRKGRGVLLGRYKLHINKLPDAHADRMSVGERKPSDSGRSSDAGDLCAGAQRSCRHQTHPEDRKRKERKDTPHNRLKPRSRAELRTPRGTRVARASRRSRSYRSDPIAPPVRGIRDPHDARRTAPLPPRQFLGGTRRPRSPRAL